ncbi:MAG TPA: TIGR04372 family glycosyltransferase, partial [Candidatus Nanoarchaeia archaeon]|nr:TIGR04372 family glycosyltransferase [Candidatus Nanoarchaeia archaeon]
RYISAHGGYALRMGSVVEKKLPDLKDDHIIDYATTSRTEFGDLYLMNKCKFFIGNTAGLVCVSYIFNVPNITTNLQLLAIPPVGKHDLFIPKKLWYQPEQRFLTFKEMIDNSVLQFMAAEDFEQHGLRFIENTPEEILAVTKEMNERIDGTWKITAEDEQLQKAFKSLYVKGAYCFGPPAARIGAQFLRDNKNLL